MYSHHILNTPSVVAGNPASTPTSPSNTTPASPRIVVLPSEASALLQSLLVENNIMPAENSNTISQDFCLFEPDESSFDYPLFAESIKLQQQQQQQQQQQLIQQGQALQQLQQQQLLQLHEQQEQHLARQYVQQQHALQQQHAQQQLLQQSTLNNSPTNPLTPQTPSLDLFDQSNPRIGTYGYDVHSFLDETSSTHSAPATVALIQLNDSLNACTIHHGDQNASGHVAQSSHLGDTPYTPYTPYLDTPYMTPYLADFGLERSERDPDANQENGTRANGNNNNNNNNHAAAFTLLADYNFATAAAALHGFTGTIEPSTLLMAVPPKEQVDYHHQPGPGSEYASDASSATSDISSVPSTPAAAHGKALFDEQLDAEEGSLEDEEEDMDDEIDMEDSFDDHDDEEDEEDEGDDDEDEYIPSRSLAAATGMSGLKRKSLPLESRHRHGASIHNNDGRRSSTGSAPSTLVSRFKRTRPELASPYEGKRKGKKSSSSKDPNATKRFVCIHPDCGRRFARLFNLHTHERTHDPHQVRPYVCEVAECGKAFSRKHDLQRHDASVHKGERNFRCDYCHRPFSRQDGLRRHLTVKGSPCTAEHAAVMAAQNKTGWIPT